MALAGLIGVGELASFDEARDELTNPAATGLRPRINRALCDAAASNPGRIASIYSPAVNGLGAFCQPYYDENGDTPPTLEPPFEGGQCSGPYTVRQTYTLASGGSNTIVRSVTGPITAYSFTNTDNGCGSGEGTIYSLTITAAAGSVSGITACVQRDSTPPPPEIIRGGGLPDNCGNTDPVPTPSPDYSRPRPVGSPTDIGDPGNPVNITIGDTITDLSGDTYVPVTIGDITVPVNVDAVGKEPDLPVRPQPPAQDGTPTPATDPAGSLDEEPTPEEEEEGIETIGYRWNFPTIPASQPPIPGTVPGRFPLIIGNLQLKLRSATGGDFWSANYVIREQSGSLIREDDSLKVVGVSWWKRPEWDTITLTPLKRQTRQDG